MCEKYCLKFAECVSLSRSEKRIETRSEKRIEIFELFLS